jgi:hypothetical protein
VNLQEGAARAGGHCWVERRLFEVLGAWGASVGGAQVKILLDRHSQHAAWRAGQWWERLPVVAGIDRQALMAPPPGWEALLGAAGSHLPAPDGDAALLAVAYRVALPRLLTRYRAHQAAATPVADGPVLRTLVQATGDAAADWEEGEAAVQVLLVDDDAVTAAAAALGAAERRVLAGGYRVGP